MQKLAVLGLAAVAAVSGAFAAKLHSRSRHDCGGVACAHYNVRRQVIESVIGQNLPGRNYLALGDSMVELADLPTICGRKPINAGIGGATAATFAEIASRFAEMAKPDFVVISLGANDASRGREDVFKNQMRHILASLAAPALLIPVPGVPGVPKHAAFNAILADLATPMAAPVAPVETTDGVHLTAGSYAKWKANLQAAADTFICPRL